MSPRAEAVLTACAVALALLLLVAAADLDSHVTVPGGVL